MNSVVVLTLLGVLALANAQTPCESPKQWQAQYFAHDSESVNEEAGSITYDEVGERIRFVVKEERNGQVVDAYEIIALYGDKNVEYQYDYETGQCTQKPIEYPFRPIGVPVDAKGLGDGYIGASGDPGAGMLVSNFFQEPRLGERYMIVVTAGACIPVTDVFTRVEGGGRYSERVTDFYDIVAPYPNATVFTPPAACL